MTQPEQHDSQLVAMEMEWPVDVAAQATVINQCLFTQDPTDSDIMYMLFGHVAPPVLLSQEAAQRHLVASGSRIQVIPRGCFVMSRTKAEEVWRALGVHLGKIDLEDL